MMLVKSFREKSFPTPDDGAQRALMAELSFDRSDDRPEFPLLIGARSHFLRCGRDADQVVGIAAVGAMQGERVGDRRAALPAGLQQFFPALDAKTARHRVLGDVIASRTDLVVYFRHGAPLFVL